MSRLAPLQPPYAPEIQAQFDRIMRGAPPLTLFRVMAGHARAWDKFRAGSLLDRGPLTLREREIVIDRTCARTGCEYEWGVHVATFAGPAHLTGEQVRATVLGEATESCWSAAEQALIAAVDALHLRATLSDAEFAALSAHYDEAKILEVLLLLLSHGVVSGERAGPAAGGEGGAVSAAPVNRRVGKAQRAHQQGKTVGTAQARLCPPYKNDDGVLRHARPQHVVDVHDADRLAAFGDDQHGHRGL